MARGVDALREGEWRRPRAVGPPVPVADCHVTVSLLGAGEDGLRLFGGRRTTWHRLFRRGFSASDGPMDLVGEGHVPLP
ncbi:hypothetical protein CDL15_Pgr008410 [Punica granatum]|uniref:Uncharacterized protein n=1 Tax=Punica granatum TaxID=22663 RepID=A0A218WNN7_PUNGR|nr:hypothetical protein CDL15_Pgr008410 [Punica granatum]